MASEVAVRVAEVILADRDDERVWTDPDSLALYLVGSFVPGSLLHAETRPVAEAILTGLDGDAPLGDVEALAEFVDAEMARIRKQG